MTPCPTFDRDSLPSDALAELIAQAETLRAELRSLGRFGFLVGKSAAMQGLYDQVNRVARCGSGALITGEAGTGKALVAQTIHALGPRRRRLFQWIDCRAQAPHEIEREFFGQGSDDPAAGGAMRGSVGGTQCGTLYFANVDRLPIALQRRLLSVLDAHPVAPTDLGKTAGADVCVLASTRCDPRDAAATGAIDVDLLQRLAAQVVRVPSLRERGEDIELLAAHFLAQLNRSADCAKALTPAAIARLRRRRWPGNVRELALAVEQAFAATEGEWLTQLDPIAGVLEGAGSGERSFRVDVGDRLDAVGKRLILATLQHTHTKEAAAQMLGVSVKTLYNRLRAYRPRPEPVRGKPDASASVPQRRTNAR